MALLLPRGLDIFCPYAEIKASTVGQLIMANLTPRELDKICRKARKISRTRRSSPSFQAATRKPPEPRQQSRKGAIRPKTSGRVGIGAVILSLGALGLLLLVFGIQLDTSARMIQTATVAVDETAWGAMLDAQGSGDTGRLERLERAGRIFTLERGTIVKMVGLGVASRKVRVIEGKAAGRAGWVHSQFVELR